MLLVGTLVLAASALVLARRDGSASLLRLGYRSLLIGALPAWIVMRGAAEWIADKEGLTGDEVPSWVDIGYSTADPGLLLLVVSTVLAGLALRRAGRSEGSGGGFSRASTVIVSLALDRLSGGDLGDDDAAGLSSLPGLGSRSSTRPRVRTAWAGRAPSRPPVPCSRGSGGTVWASATPRPA